MATFKKITLNTSEEVYCTLQYLCTEMGGITITDLIKRSVALQKFVWENRASKLLFEDKDGSLRQIVLLP